VLGEPLQLRVLLVSWEYPPVMYGGLGRHVDALSRSLAAQGHDVVVLTQGRPGHAPTSTVEVGDGRAVRVVRAVLDADFPDVHTDTEAFVRRLQPGLVAAARLLPEHWVPDVVHAHDWVVADAAVTLRASLRRPLVVTLHATETGLHHGHLATEFSRWRHDVECGLAADAAAIVVCSLDMRSEVTHGLGADPARVVVVPNGVDPDAWATTVSQRDAARRALGVGDARLVVLVGRLEHEKGGHDAIEALSLVEAPAHLVLVGEGARRADLQAHAQRLGLGDRVHLPGRLPDVGVAAVVASADVALVPSRYEPFGLVALEAMAAGTPVVAAATGGLRDVVADGVTGRLVPPGTPTALAEAIDALLADPAVRRRLTERAAAAVRDRFDWAVVAAATAQVYADVLD
jgi:glycogen(starch) synthase